MTSAVDALILERDDENFLYRIMKDHRASILGVVQRFKTLDPLYDQEDLEQEAFFGVRLAALQWEDARAINMQFKTYLNWHISRHFQAKFKGDDKIVDIFDANNRLLVTIPYAKYRRIRRTIAQDKGYSTRIRSLLVYYDDPPGDVAQTSKTDTEFGAPLHLNGDRVADVYNANDQLIITLPVRTYRRMRWLIEVKGYRARTYSIYDPPVRPEPLPVPILQPALPREEDMTFTDLLAKIGNGEIKAITFKVGSLRAVLHNGMRVKTYTDEDPDPEFITLLRNKGVQIVETPVIDVYNRRRQPWMRLTPAQYDAARVHIETFGGVIRRHTLEQYPVQPLYEDLPDFEPVSVTNTNAADEIDGSFEAVA